MTISHLHNPNLDRIRSDASDFIRGLGVQPTSLDKMTVVLSDQGDEIRDYFRKGPAVRAGYRKQTGEVFVIAGEGKREPLAIQVQDTSFGVHELMHSGSLALDEHPFYTESLAGLAERDYLNTEASRFPARQDSCFIVDDVRFHLSGEYRYFGNTANSHTSQGLIGAHGLSIAMEAGNISSSDLYERARLDGNETYELMRYALTQLDPTLPQRINALDRTASGVFAASALIQAAA